MKVFIYTKYNRLFNVILVKYLLRKISQILLMISYFGRIAILFSKVKEKIYIFNYYYEIMFKYLFLFFKKIWVIKDLKLKSYFYIISIMFIPSNTIKRINLKINIYIHIFYYIFLCYVWYISGRLYVIIIYIYIYIYKYLFLIIETKFGFEANYNELTVLITSFIFYISYIQSYVISCLKRTF